MVKNLLSRGKKIFLSQQTSILSAATVIMVMIVLSQVFGLARQWVILRFLGKENFALYLAAFRLPDLVFEVFAFGVFSSAFIPVFSKYLRRDVKEAWEVAARAINAGILIFGVFALVFGIFSYQIYSLIAYGYTHEQTLVVSRLARVIFLAQGLFVVSYVLTGVLESAKRFLIPALAPLFYNLGIIVGTLIFSKNFGVFAPPLGVVLGAVGHLLVQFPLAHSLGFRFSSQIRPNEGVREIGRLAAPRFAELGFLQIQKSSELFFSSLMPIASYAYLNLANSLASVPITIFGVSLAKAALVSLAHEEGVGRFRAIFMKTFYQMMFFVVPAATFMIVLRIPIVRLIYGTSHSLDWEGTIQIGLILSYFALSIPLQAALALLSRAYYARHDTKIPVIISIADVILTLLLEAFFVFFLKLPVYSLALANTLAMFIQVSLLYAILSKKLGRGDLFSLTPVFKVIFASLTSGGAMFFLLKIFDKSVWVKRLSFLGRFDSASFLPFEKFVLDTRYTFNLLILTIIVSGVGVLVYLGSCLVFRSKELFEFSKLIKKVFIHREFVPIPEKEEEPLTPPLDS